MRIAIRETAFDPLEELGRHQTSMIALQGKYGATASFIGTLRDHNEGEPVKRMRLEHYPGMTERYLQRLAENALARWELLDVLIIHRVGELHPNDPIVLVAVWSAHRAAAFEACRSLIEGLKSQAPFWKKEILPDGERWLEKNTAGHADPGTVKV